MSLYNFLYSSCPKNENFEFVLILILILTKTLSPLTPDRPQVKRPPPSLQITSNFLVSCGLSHGITLEKKFDVLCRDGGGFLT